MSIVAAELIARVSADTGPADRELRNWSNRLGGSGGALSGITDVFTGNILADGVKALGRGITNVGRVGALAIGGLVSAGADFEAQMDSINAVLGGTAAESEALSDLAIQLAIDPRLKVSTDEATAAIYNLATAGLSAEEILGGATEATVLLANATQGDFGQAATVATNVMSLFNINADDMMAAIDGIAAVSNVSTFGLEDYAQAIAQAGGVAALSGVDFEDFNAIIAGTAEVFGSGSDAGTSFKTFLQRLQPTTKEAKDLMSELGLVTEDGTSIFYDATGALKDMDDIVAIMNSTFGDMTEAQQSFYMGQIFGTDAMRTAGQVSKMTRKEYQALLRTMGNTSALDMAAESTDNFKSRWEGLVDTVDAIGKSIWHDLDPIAADIALKLNPVLDTAGTYLIGIAEDFGAWLEAEIPAVEVAVKTAFELTDSPFAAVMTGLAELTGAAIEFDAKGIVTLDWGGVDMEFDAVGNVKMMWEGRSLGASASWGPDKPMEVEAHVNWGNVGEDFRSAMFPDTGTAADLFKMPTIQWEGSPADRFLDRFRSELEIGAYGVEVRMTALWGTIWTTIYDASAAISVDWQGIWDAVYNINVIPDVDWGTVFDSAKTIVVNLIPNWLGGGDEPPPPSDPAAGVPRFRTDRQRGGGGWSGADENATGNAMFGGGWTWVGERGPELVRLPRASRIYDADESAGMGGVVNITNQNIIRNPLEADIYARRTADYLRRKQRR